MMKRSLFLAISATSMLMTSCGSDDPQGKFTNKDQTQTGDSANAGQFIHNPTATSWLKGWSESNTVVYQWRSEPDNMHPTNSAANARRFVMDLTQRFLIGSDLEKLELRPDLAKALPTLSPDGLDYTYELREEPRWDDGTPVTVDDVIFSIMVNKCPNVANMEAKPYFETIDDVVKDPSNPRKFTVKMNRVYIQNVALFADIPIMQRSFFDKDNVMAKYSLKQFNDPQFSKTKHPDLDAWATNYNKVEVYGTDLNNLTGLGAYKITAWEAGQRMELTRKPNHWTSKLQNPTMYDRSYPEKIILKVVRDDNAIALEFKNQTVDASGWVATMTLVDLQKDPEFMKNYHSAYVPNFGYQYIGMNLKPLASNRTPFFVDKRVRHAMALLTPIDEINANFYGGKNIRMTSLICPVKKLCYNTDLKPVPLDVEAAKKLLDEAGWKDTDGDNIRDKMIDGKKVQFNFEFSISAGSQIVLEVANYMAASMRKAGIIANVHPIDFAKFSENNRLHNFDMYWGSWMSSYGPEDFKQIWHSASWENGGSNYVGFGTPATDQLIETIRGTLNDTTRAVMEKQLQAMIYDEQPYIFMYQAPYKLVIHKRFDNADMYFEKPGILTPNLRVMSPGTMSKSGTAN